MYLDLHAHNSQYQIDLDSLLDFLNKELIKKQSHYEADHRALWNARGVVGGKLPHAMTDRFNRVYIADKALSELDNFDLRCWIREASILIRAENQSSLQGALEAVCIKYSKQLEFNLSGFERVFKTYSSNYQEAKKLYQQIKTLKDKIQEASLDINSLLKLEDQDTKEFELEACRKMRTSLETERGALVKK